MVRSQWSQRNAAQTKRDQNKHHEKSPEQNRRANPWAAHEKNPAAGRQVKLRFSIDSGKSQPNNRRSEKRLDAAGLLPFQLNLLFSGRQRQRQLAVDLAKRLNCSVNGHRLEFCSFRKSQRMLATEATA